MASSGLSADNKTLLKGTTHFVDVVASGSGIAYVVEDLLRDFKRAKKAYPALNILVLNEINIHNASDRRNASIADQDAKDGDSLTFSFPSKDNVHFRMPAVVTYLPGHTKLDMLPSNDWRVFPQYNAFYWQPCFDALLTKEPSSYMKTLLEYFDENIQNLIRKSQQK